MRFKTYVRNCYAGGIVLQLLLVSIANTAAGQRSQSAPPHLEQRGHAKQLIVDGKPFLILGGELRNSSSSSLNYLQPILNRVKLMHMNTVLAPVTWDLLEPVEGKYDFGLVDGLIKQARLNNLRVIILWFGTWKNGLSSYAPDWIKTNPARFPLVKLSNNKSIATVTPFSKACLQADIRAFYSLMQYVKAVDGAKHTVIMVQVENEVGVHGDTRDRSDAANAAFQQAVPTALINSLQTNKADLQPEIKKAWADNGYQNSGSWEKVFGKSKLTDEVFMAWHYAGYVNAVAAAGKAKYHLPMYVNAWLPPNHPSGGPVAEVHDIWRAGAPDIDIFSPDVYKPNFRDIVPNYYHNWNPLFIPECVADSAGASNAYLAIGRYSAIGFSPFAVDDRIPDLTDGAIPRAYLSLGQAAATILQAQSKGSITAVTVDKDNPFQTVIMGGYKLQVKPRAARYKSPGADSGYGYIIHSGTDEFIISGVNVEVSFSSSMPDNETVGLLSVYDGGFKNGIWTDYRKLNGDETMLSYSLSKLSAQNLTGEVVRIQGNNQPGTLKVNLYKFK